MRVTKYAQSCVLIETQVGNVRQRILIDPGCLMYDEGLLKAWTGVDAILVTHSHKDHIHEGAVSQLVKSNAKLYSSAEVKSMYTNLSIEVVKVGDVLSVGDVKIEAVDAVHGYLHRFRMEEGMEINENIGFIVDDGSTRLYHTSDSIGFRNDYKCDILVIPVSGHGISFGPYDAADYAVATGATTTIPCHYDHPAHPVDMAELRKEFKMQNRELRILEIGDSIDV